MHSKKKLKNYTDHKLQLENTLLFARNSNFIYDQIIGSNFFFFFCKTNFSKQISNDAILNTGTKIACISGDKLRITRHT